MDKDKETSESSESLEIIEFAGRKFQNTPEGLAQLSEYGAKLSSLTGKVTNENGQLKKKISKYQKQDSINLPDEIEDPAEALKTLVGSLKAEKESQQKDSWYGQLSKAVAEESGLDPELIQPFLEKHKLADSEDPFSDAVSLLSGRVPVKKQEKPEEDKGHLSFGERTTVAAPKQESKGMTLEDVEKAALKALGFK